MKNEKLTRKEIIDNRLKQAGWNVTDPTHVIEECFGKGDVSKRNLIESPFTMLHPEGIRGVFNQKEIEEILNLTEQVVAA